ncbi:MAG: Bifunctional PGK/TIM [Candidatus Nomurabacteria bacterium GW2011_GWF2_35_66]|uniref:Triosephosphate isomerase n=1 Tax=Candidatus Nomurabacteria bacterium GW2011_GWE1_35_16 TaxID=1618761 RepID=A0A0G0EFE3_9BACT|nr:MAG: Bifunctional PGK/TIM [Candidatus Nomurabacteria bacterium GW2011_GWF1_34_20]KKP62106.1 MAG: Bifunctional PGK/TIM [Candidatus Nomurabacteria bacterium GW2011_GWE2_34_25]KKP66072.1 MAG: Bifunctional PGK/TIM [Candidatus Nomurabacteria bacterium GW2011_GWE1_35_16]KKP83022.1 MAG: Bifunctional PGK/TIM [Candidatus Nomurabacteria bacterium GW2011_GWF2_35_66]HAE36981.1 triose-phosphate isomerase [Candidatus Nomurabacteria bacterium]
MKPVNKLIIANWKMNPQKKTEAEAIFKDISTFVKNIKNTEIIICPPFPYFFIKDKIKGKKLKLGSQDVFYEKEGSHTGEVSASMLKDFGVEYVLVGHSERRSLGDTNDQVNKKILAVIKSKMCPIFCIGESEKDANGFYLSFIKQQITEGLLAVTKSQAKNIIIAYEPIWAIGSNATRVATPAEFTEIRIFIKKILSDLYDIKTASGVRILYGGSVNPLNAESFIKEGGADGLLVGRDSLTPKKFIQIINLAR